MSLDDLLQSILGGGNAGQRRSGAGEGDNDPMADLLQSMLGGETNSQQGGGLEDILGGILGGGAAGGESLPQSSGQAGGGGLMDIISSVLNGSAGGAVQEQSTSIIEGVSGKTGMSQMLVQLVLSFVMSKLLGGMAGGGSGMGGLLPGMEDQPAPSQSRAQPSGGGLDLDSLLKQLSQDPSMADELAQKTGLDKGTAQQSLQEVLDALGQQRRSSSAGASRPKTGGMDDLLLNR
jgi:hypothetical protein